MRGKPAISLAAYYVRSVPYAGDLPYLEVGLGDTIIYFNSDTRGRFQISTNFDPDISPRQQRNDGIFKQPEWAFLINNGTDQLYLHMNAGACRMTIRNTKSDINIESLMTEDQAEMLSTSFRQAFFDKTPLHRDKHKLKPLGIYYTYKVNTIVIDPR